jgi:hypothetical protein
VSLLLLAYGEIQNLVDSVQLAHNSSPCVVFGLKV